MSIMKKTERFFLNFKGIIASVEENAIVAPSAGSIVIYTTDPTLFEEADVLPESFEGVPIKFMKCELPTNVENL